MIKKIFFCLILLGCSFCLNGCLAFRWQALKDQTGKKISVQKPPAPWKTAAKEGWQASWQNPGTKSVLSYLSACSASTSFTSLKDFTENLLSGLKKFHILKTSKTRHLEYPAHLLNLKGSNSQKKVKRIEILLFKTAKCFYVLSLLAHSDKIPSMDRKIFHQFIKGFNP